MEKPSIYIVDDDAMARQALREALAPHGATIVGEADDGPTAILPVINSQPDILFLDVELPSMTGIELCRILRPHLLQASTRVVFFSAHPQYMINALHLQAFDFLLKPFTQQDLDAIMRRYHSGMLTSISSVAGRGKDETHVLLVTREGSMVAINLRDVVYFEYSGTDRAWRAVCQDGQQYVLRQRITADTILQVHANFVQISKLLIVNLSYVKMLKDNLCILTTDMPQLRISRNYRKHLLDSFLSL